MEFRDLKKQYQVLKNEIDNAMISVATGGIFIGGMIISDLEKSLAEYVGVRHCITCANGTDALTMMMMALGVKSGDAVFVPDFTFFATAEIVAFQGATPIFVDVEKDTFNMDCKALEKEIISIKKEGKLHLKAIIPVDLFGLPANYHDIMLVAKKYNLFVLEDGAQGFGGEIDGQKACSFGDAAITSFFPAKPLGCYGDGGAIFTNDDNIANYVRSIQVHGKGTSKYDNIRIGMNSRLDTIQAAILQVKYNAFKNYELVNVNLVAKQYSEKLAGIIQPPYVPKGFMSSWAQYTLLFENTQQRDNIQNSLKRQGIPTMVYYPIPLHNQKAFEMLPYKNNCTVSEMLCQRVLSFPIDPYKDEKSIDIVIQALKIGLSLPLIKQGIQ
ncbi:TPA: aminotransferase DegT [Candidatus Uhrbacteria bacterium]|nr:aminotransferase DegT [Candidatus Uhrbacteria bacterium]